MFTIAKEFHFSASHALYDFPPDHKCYRLHGHNYVVVVELQSRRTDEKGVVLDYGELSPVQSYIDQTLDHRHLNDVLPFHPTAELLAEHLYKVFRLFIEHLASVTVKETEKTSATYRP